MRPGARLLRPLSFLLCVAAAAWMPLAARAAADVSAGQRVYDRNCVACHGSSGRGRIPGAPDFTAPGGVLTLPDATLLQRMTEGYHSPGSPASMPPNGGDPSLTQRDLANVLAYLREAFLRPGETGPGEPAPAQPPSRGYGGGMMGGGMMGGGMMGEGMMGRGMTGRGAEQSVPPYGRGLAPGTLGSGGSAQDLTAAEVRRLLEQRLHAQGGAGLRVGEVEEKGPDFVVATIVTDNGAPVERLIVDRHSGRMQRLP
jgi:mono/diheme cytochrome c family protein